ncbi:MAG: endonuclease [Bacteroidales bacterium]|jgi:endonuclease I|nr:endonuclease [Bacteroidales bacterium]
MKKIITLTVIFSWCLAIFSQIPAGYYYSANEKSGNELQQALSNIIDNHRTVTYASLWQHFYQTDTKGDSIIWDIYSDNPQNVNSYDFIYSIDQCGQVGSGEGHCYNREHTFCQSWFGGGTGAPYSDLFHIYPVDGYINSTRNNYAYGIVTSPQRIFSNGSKYGKNQADNAPYVNSFEPIDDYKGDIARSFFYMAVRYMFEDENFVAESPMTYQSQLQPWALKMFMDWHLLDPVSGKERDRNNAIYRIQQNRNPFIDYPELARKIWGSDSIYPFLLDDTITHHRPKIDCFEVKTLQILQLHVDMPLLFSSAVNLENYTIQSGPGVEQVQYINDTLYLYLSSELQNGKNYYLIVHNLQAENQYFMTDTSIAFMAGVPQSSEIIAMWMFDQLEGKPNVPTRISADVLFQDFAMICMDGSYGSSSFNTSFSNAQLDAFSGTLVGDPQGSDATASQSLAVIGESANGNSMVFAFATADMENFTMTFACRRTSSGFSEHQWEWSTNGVDYQIIDNSNTVAQVVGEFELCHLSLLSLHNLNEADTTYLRLSLSGATSSTGNNRFDNIVIYGEKSTGINNYSPVIPGLFFSLHPNPIQSKVKITINDRSTWPYSLQCIDLQGKIVHTSQLDSNASEIDLSFLKSGVYMIVIHDKERKKSGSKKIVIQQ